MEFLIVCPLAFLAGFVDAIAGGDVAGARKYAEEHLAGLKDFVRREGSKLSKHVVNVHLK